MSHSQKFIPTEPSPDLADLDRKLIAKEAPRTVFRDFLRYCRTYLFTKFDRGAAVGGLITAYTGIIDELLKRAWRLYIPKKNACCTLIAVGGYGRGELHPGSDIDILILFGEPPENSSTDEISNFIYLLFDMGLKLGHSVRTIEECTVWAEKDITVITNLLESRLLVGSETLYREMQRAIGPERLWPSEAFFAAKWQEQKERWKKFGNTAYNLEPNIKENPGGLRDIQMIGWVCRRHFGTRTLHELVQRAFLTESEYRALIDGQTLLWRIRYALHRVAGRCEDRLLFVHQRTLAELFGFIDDGNNLAIEQFMQQYYRTVMELNRLNEMLMQLFQEAIVFKNQFTEPNIINTRFQARSGYLETRNDKVFEYNPVAILEIFLLLQTYPELQGVRASAIRQIRANLWRIDDKFRQDIRARSLFMEILRHTDERGSQLPRMNSYGILAAYIPTFNDIVGRMQYDLFHVYTVDAHTLFLIQNLHRFTIPRYSNEFPLASAIAHTIPKLEILYLAGLFHDIAKGRGGDHSELGAKDALDFCQLHDLSDYDSRLVSWLVRKHLIMSMTAQRKDTSDPDVIQAFASAVGDLNRLDYLYLLTVADVRATNPERWNAWKDALLRELYHSTRQALQRGLCNPQAQDDLLQQKQTEALRLLQLQGVNAADCQNLWAYLNRDFCLHSSPAEIAWQTKIILDTKPNQFPHVAIRPETERGCTQILLYTIDRDGLFAWSSALMAQLGLNVMDARIITTEDNRALNLYLVLEQNGNIINDLERQRTIKSVLEQGLRYPDGAEPRLSWNIPYQHKFFNTETKIYITQDATKNRTVLRMVTIDRPGLLAEVGQVFSACQVRLHNAKIATIGAEVEDIFFITDRNNQLLTNHDQLECLHQQIYSRLDKRNQATLTGVNTK